ncbi:hypothetical protein B0O99DRAFT_680604 [Bisporella sp. PMI_857]|nr:hypothetical protein B0O99DRAFT_680604 [Bisporella sp. PMI_857]
MTDEDTSLQAGRDLQFHMTQGHFLNASSGEDPVDVAIFDDSADALNIDHMKADDGFGGIDEIFSKLFLDDDEFPGVDEMFSKLFLDGDEDPTVNGREADTKADGNKWFLRQYIETIDGGHETTDNKVVYVDDPGHDFSRLFYRKNIDDVNSNADGDKPEEADGDVTPYCKLIIELNVKFS